ncbi:hypothetical protein LTR17_010451 [Elasticomyces elasticus]|nr:hypothetical protein LTR17_010451 [Elasticomyces elasticus]
MYANAEPDIRMCLLLAYVEQEPESLAIALGFLVAMFCNYAQYLTIAYIQFGATQTTLGVPEDLQALSDTQALYATSRVIPAAEAADTLPAAPLAVLAALPLGATVPRLTTAITTAAGGAFVESYVPAVKTVALALIDFGYLAGIACLLVEDLGSKMTPKIEIVLENEVQADQNKFHSWWYAAQAVSST